MVQSSSNFDVTLATSEEFTNTLSILGTFSEKFLKYKNVAIFLHT